MPPRDSRMLATVRLRTHHFILAVILAFAVLMLTRGRSRRTDLAKPSARASVVAVAPKTASPKPRVPAPVPPRNASPPRSPTPIVSHTGRASPDSAEPVVVPFVVEDDVAVTMTDLVLGVPDQAVAGRGHLKTPAPWRQNEIAFLITPGLPNPERVLAALRAFEGTPISFKPFITEDDVMVFVPGTGACKSYLGRIGGKQPIWLSPGCGPTEIAHEIMHALGFIHEQNRADRNAFIRVLIENVESGNEINFARLPESYSGHSGLTPFDYTSIMIYPKTMFGVGGRDTLESVRPGIDIEPGRTLSASDRDRLTRAYGRWSVATPAAK